MLKPYRTQHPVLSPINNRLIDLPAPQNLSTIWNFGSLLGLCLAVQILTGLFLAIHYCANIEIAFSSIAHISRDVNYGWLLRAIHANGASWFFICLYIHVGRGIYYGSYILNETWNIGVVLLILTIATAFVGYVLVWGQIRFWGATVITNLLSAAPYIGQSLVEWVWGGFAVDNATLNRFFTFHFILPFAILAITVLHLLFLHQTGSSNPLGLNSTSSKIPFHPYYTFKDLIGFVILLAALILISLISPNYLTDPENYLPANPLVTPLHIKPEWYFLWAYAILRSIPNKLGGVVAIFSAILVLLTLPISIRNKCLGISNNPPAQFLFWCLIVNVILLTWIGGRPVEAPYEILGQIFTFFFFICFIILPIFSRLWIKTLYFWIL